MNVKELISLIDGHLYNDSADLTREVLGGYGADLMSDVLTLNSTRSCSLKPDLQSASGANIRNGGCRGDNTGQGKNSSSRDHQARRTGKNCPYLFSLWDVRTFCGRLYAAGLQNWNAQWTVTIAIVNNRQPDEF